ncbi:MAG TPA: TolC family protein [Bacteroidales bacterium]|nr:TolC family protein [Bacteroidales bacterium]HPI69107.1 TolC family protein [Bacteroidales bacterium]HPR12247.1 TolC family protein [Bacteroidales bacterium]HRW83903.1 TolC family protein [Bacteroidales bacterium]
MKKMLLIILAALSFTGGTAIAQQKEWTLEECIRHAIENNIQIKQQEIQTEYQENALDLSKLRLLPTLSGQATHNYSFGRALDQTTYQYTDQENVQSNNFYLGGNLSVFKGLQNYNTIRKSKYDLLASDEDLKNIRNNISLSVALDYLQILLNRELVASTGNQLDITRQQINKTRTMVEAGSVPLGNQLQIEAQAAQEELQLISLQNQLSISYLNLAQLLELASPEGFEVFVPQLQVDTNTVIDGNIDGIFESALATRPEVIGSEYRLTSSEYDLRIARGSRIPQITMNHSFSTGYSSIRQKILGIDPVTGPLYGDYNFADQVNDNISYGIGFSLSVPILNGWQINKNISNSKLMIENSRYTLDATKKQLFKNIQQAHADAVASLKQYKASMKAVASMEESFRYTEQRFNVGMVTPVDYNAAKTQLLNAQSDMTRAKYEFIFKIRVLDFYKGLPLSLNQ